MTDDLEGIEKAGLIEEEKTFTNDKLGGTFVFRLPFIMDDLDVLKKRALLMGIREDLAGPELVALSHAKAMFEVYCVHKPHKFKMDKIRSWGPFMKLMMEVREWHDNFRQEMGDEEESPGETESKESDSLVPMAV